MYTLTNLPCNMNKIARRGMIIAGFAIVFARNDRNSSINAKALFYVCMQTANIFNSSDKKIAKQQ